MSETSMKKSYQDDPYALTYPETMPFWQAAEANQFLVKGCNNCNKAHWYPRVVCPFCGSDQTNWTEASGQGTIYSFSLIERADPPYVLAWVTLDEGPVITTNIVDCELASVKIGDKVKVKFRPTTEGRLMPVFVPI
jgi:uncharacterized OB-fold protein